MPWQGPKREAVSLRPPQATPAPAKAHTPRSSNLRITQQFTDRDRNRFRQEAFEFIFNFFSGSIEELKARSAGVEGETGLVCDDPVRFGPERLWRAVAEALA